MPATNDTQPVRGAEGNILFSSEMPTIRLRVDPSLQFVGGHRFVIMGVAAAEIVYFAETRDGVMQRAFHGQFEHYLEHTPYSYNYELPGTIQLGQHEYMYDTHVFNAAAAAKERPGSDTAEKHRWLTDLGYANFAWTVSTRFVRLLDEARRHEVLFIYQEALEGSAAESLLAAGRDSPGWRQMEETLHTRALQAFTVIEE